MVYLRKGAFQSQHWIKMITNTDKYNASFKFRNWNSRTSFQPLRPWHRFINIHAPAVTGIFLPLPNLCAVQVHSWRKTEYFRMKCVGSQRANTIPSTSSIPAENIFSEWCFRRHQAQQKEIFHSWKETGMWHTLTVWGTAARERC